MKSKKNIKKKILSKKQKYKKGGAFLLPKKSTKHLKKEHKFWTRPNASDCATYPSDKKDDSLFAHCSLIIRSQVAGANLASPEAAPEAAPEMETAQKFRKAYHKFIAVREQAVGESSPILSQDILPNIIDKVWNKLKYCPQRARRTLSGKKASSVSNGKHIKNGRYIAEKLIMRKVPCPLFDYYIKSEGRPATFNTYPDLRDLYNFIIGYITYKSSEKGWCGEVTSLAMMSFFEEGASNIISLAIKNKNDSKYNHVLLLLPPDLDSNLKINDDGTLNFDELIKKNYIIYDPLHNYIISNQSSNLNELVNNTNHSNLTKFKEQLTQYCGNEKIFELTHYYPLLKNASKEFAECIENYIEFVCFLLSHHKDFPFHSNIREKLEHSALNFPI